MYNNYLATYKNLTAVLKEMYKEYAFKNWYDHKPMFTNPADFYNCVIIQYLCSNRILSNLDGIYFQSYMKNPKRVTHTLFDELMNCSFNFDKSNQKEYEIYACEEYISTEIGRDFLVIENYLRKNRILSESKIFEYFERFNKKLKNNIGIKEGK